jgi:hypothetical protein
MHCSRRWVSLLEATAPHLETLWLRINTHRPGSRFPTAFIALPNNFLASHPRLRRLVLENAFLLQLDPRSSTLSHSSRCSPSTHPLRTLHCCLVPTHKQLLDCLLLMPALEELNLAHCLPYVIPTPSPRAVHLGRLRALTLQDRVDRCHQVFHSLGIPATATVKVVLWSCARTVQSRFSPKPPAHSSRIFIAPVVVSPPGAARAARAHSQSLPHTIAAAHTFYCLPGARSPRRPAQRHVCSTLGPGAFPMCS